MLLWTLTALWLDAARPAPPGPYDAVVVLGCRVLTDGRLSPTLARRVHAGAALVQAGVASQVVVTGGAVAGRPQEAAAMARELLGLGLTPDQIVLEPRAQNTLENARFTVALLPGAKLLVVSDSWHLPRALRLFRAEGAQVAGHGVQGPLPHRLRGAFREVPGYLLSRIRDWR